MKIGRFLILLFIAFFLSSCAKNLLVNYQAEPGNTTNLVLKFSKVSHHAKLSVNDKLLVEGKLARSVTLRNLPAGSYDIKCWSNSGWKKDKVCTTLKAEINGAEKTVVKNIDLPVKNGWYWIGITSLVVWPIVLVAGFTL
jgi:hypothetical protein